MGSASWLATALDQEMLEVAHGVQIAPRTTPTQNLAPKNGQRVSNELGGRYLLRYMLPHQVRSFTDGSEDQHFVTPTSYAPEETVSWLALPRPAQPRLFVMLLDPRAIPVILGPRWIRLGKGIEYVLPNGFPKNSLVWPWPVAVT